MRLGVLKMGSQADAVGANTLAVLLRLPFVWYGIGALIVGILLARWTWILFAPHTLGILPPKPDMTGDMSSSLFGAVAASSVGAATGASLSNVRLLGVFSGEHGFAVLRLEEKRQLGVALGEEVTKGMRLIEVAADHVVLDYNGGRQRVNLENKFTEANGVPVNHLAATTAPVAEQAAAEWKQMSHSMQKEQEIKAAALAAEKAIAASAEAAKEMQKGQGISEMSKVKDR